jgi:ADP-heptose:LPS heptosyltransferase
MLWQPFRVLRGLLLPDRQRRARMRVYLRRALTVWLDREPGQIWFHCDHPDIHRGLLLRLKGPVEFKGWAVAARGIASVTFSCDGTILGEAEYGLARPDVAAHLTHLRQSIRSGFRYVLDTDRLPVGPHTLTLTARSRDGIALSHGCAIEVVHAPNDYARWRAQTAATPAALAWMRRHLAFLPEQPTIALALPLMPATVRTDLEATLRSVQAQAYPHWHLYLLCDKPAYEQWGDLLAAACQTEARITLRVEPFPATDSASADLFQPVGGELVGLISPGDVLDPEALFEVVAYFHRHPETELVYTNEDALFDCGTRDRPIFKEELVVDGRTPPDAIGRLWIARRNIVGDAAGEADFLGRILKCGHHVGHVRTVLYSRKLPRAQEPQGPSVSDSRYQPPIVRQAFAPYPMLDRGQVRRILAIRLDHLGDLLLTFPAISRLQELFPQAEITLLVGSWARALAESHPCVKQVLTYDYFNASSAQPPNTLPPLEHERIRDWLGRYRFDLAIDFRRENETSEFLRWSGAPLTAGFANAADCPWLSVSMPYEPNAPRERPRLHISQEHVQLVDRLRTVSQVGVWPEVRLTSEERMAAEEALDASIPLQSFPLVAIHPGSGRSIKCWPVEHFSRLADRCCERLGAFVVLLGAPSESALVQDVLQRMCCSGDAASLVGQLSVRQLLAVLPRFDLFVGNDSGPTHLAAAQGGPTLCIGSGTNDPLQWAPLGPSALTIHRRMACSPCHLRERDECPFDVACLRDLSVEEVWEALLRVLLPKWKNLLGTPALPRSPGFGCASQVSGPDSPSRVGAGSPDCA